ncbi:putative gustatory receptor 22c [Zeugodacus cucurbitae]|uniref:putative gustatory receptor 22c n=1 Tax=Zeugodacus cucurbitae TaxID=28588 RepID=UPI0023D9494A|nr:putative gustatory receptor 22c [Zeugodacus cucurbitae]
MQTAQSARGKFAHFVHRFIFKTSMFLGLLPFKYNREKNTFRLSRFALSYSIVMNSLIFFWVVKNWPDMSNYELFIEKPLHYIVEIAITYVNSVGMVLLFCTTWTGRKRLLALFNEIVAVKQLCDAKDFLRNYDASKQEKRIIVKFCSMLLQNLVFVMAMFFVSSIQDWSFILVLILAMIMLNEMYLISNQFYHNALFINHSILAVNHRLRCLSTKRQPASAGEINDIFGVYMRLIRLIAQIMKAYEQQLLVIISVRLSVVVQCLFYTCMLFGGKELNVQMLDLLYYLEIILLTSLDYWLIMGICESVWRAQQQTEVELQNFSNFHILQTRVARDVRILLCLTISIKYNIPTFF